MRLAVAVCSGDALREHGRVPGEVEVDHHGGSLQVQAHAARIGREEHLALWILEELLDKGTALLGGYVAGELDPAQLQTLEHRLGQGEHARPLAEHDGLVPVAGDLLAQDLTQFAQLGSCLLPVLGLDLWIVERQRVADQAHLDQAPQQNLVFLRRERTAAGACHQLGDPVLILTVGRPLRIGHLDEEVAVHALGQIEQNILSHTAHHVRPDAAA